jgi:hypothetical protein
MSKGYPQRGYMKWLVLGFMWRRVSPLVRSRNAAATFRTLCEKGRGELLNPLLRGIDQVYLAASRYYRLNRGTGDKQMDPSLFFRSKRGRDREFEAFWQRPGNHARKPFEKRMQKVQAVLHSE